MRQEIISNEEAQEDEIVNDPFEVEGERNLDVFELEIQVLAQHCYFDELKLHLLGLLLLLRVLQIFRTTLLSEVASLLAPSAPFVLVLQDGLSQDEEMRLVSAQSQHDQVGICSINAVGNVWIIILLSSLASDEIKNFVLAFAWN